MSTDEADTMDDGFAAKELLGWSVAAGLLLATLVEYFVAIKIDDPLWWLMPFIIIKGALIIEYFMHFTGLFNSEEH